MYIIHVADLWSSGSGNSILPEMKLSCFLDEQDLDSCLKEFSSSASPSPHQDGWPYNGVPRGSAVTSPDTNKCKKTFKPQGSKCIFHCSFLELSECSKPY